MNSNSSHLSSHPPNSNESALGYSIGYWTSGNQINLPKHEITHLQCNTIRSILFTSSSQGQSIVWLKNSISNENLNSQGYNYNPHSMLLSEFPNHVDGNNEEIVLNHINNPSGITPIQPAVTSLLYTQYAVNHHNCYPASINNHIHYPQCNYYFVGFSNGNISKYSEDGSICYETNTLFNNLSVLNLFHYSVDLEHHYLIIHYQSSPDILIVNSTNFNIVRKIQQCAIISAITLKTQYLYVLTEDSMLIQWDLAALDLANIAPNTNINTNSASSFTASPLNYTITNIENLFAKSPKSPIKLNTMTADQILVSFTHPANLTTVTLRCIHSTVKMIELSSDFTRLLIVCDSHWIILDCKTCKPIIASQAIHHNNKDSRYVKGCFYSNSNSIVILLKTTGKVNIMNLKPIENTKEESAKFQFVPVMVGSLKLPINHTEQEEKNKIEAENDDEFIYFERQQSNSIYSQKESVEKISCIECFDSIIYCGTTRGSVLQFDLSGYNFQRKDKQITEIYPQIQNYLMQAFQSADTISNITTKTNNNSTVASHSLLISDGLHESTVNNVSILLARAYSNGEIIIHRLLSSHISEDNILSEENENTQNHKSNIELSVQLHNGPIGHLISISSHENVHNIPILISSGSIDYNMVFFDLKHSIIMASFPMSSNCLFVDVVQSIVYSEPTLNNTVLIANDLVCIVCEDYTVRVISISDLNLIAVLRLPVTNANNTDDGIAEVVKFHRFQADLIYNRLLIETSDKTLLIYNLVDSSLECSIAPPLTAKMLIAMKNNTRCAEQFNIEHINNLKWGHKPINSSNAAQTDNKENGHSNDWGLLGKVGAIAYTPIAWLAAGTKYLYRVDASTSNNSSENKSNSNSKNINNMDQSDNSNSELITSFHSYSQLHFTHYTINIDRLSQILQSQYSTLVTKVNGNDDGTKTQNIRLDTDKSLVYKALLSPLLDFDIEFVSNILQNHFKMNQPIPPSTFIVNSNNNRNYCVLFPNSNNARNRWGYSSYFSGQHNLILTTIFYSLLMNTDSTAHHHYAQLENYYNSTIIQHFSNSYVESDPTYLLNYRFSTNISIQNSANLLIKGLLQRATHNEKNKLCQLLTSYFSPLDITEPVFIEDRNDKNIRNNNNTDGGVDNNNKAHTATITDSEVSDSILASAQRSESKLLKTKTLTNLFNQVRSTIITPSLATIKNKLLSPIKTSMANENNSNLKVDNEVNISPQSLDSELLASMFICYSSIQKSGGAHTRNNTSQIPLDPRLAALEVLDLNDEYETRLPQICRCLLRVIHAYKPINHNLYHSRLSLSISLFSSHINRLKPYILNADISPFIAKLFSIYCPDNEFTTTNTSNLVTGTLSIQTAVSHLLTELGTRVPQLYCMVMAKFIIDTTLNNATRKAAALCIVNLIKAKFNTIHIILPLATYLLLRVLDPANNVLRQSLLNTVLITLNSLSEHNSFCSLYRNVSSNIARFAVINNNNKPEPAILVYDLIPAKRIKSFVSKTSIYAITFNGDGSQLAGFNAGPNIINIWNINPQGSAGKRLLKGLLKMNNNELAKTIPITFYSPNTMSNDKSIEFQTKTLQLTTNTDTEHTTSTNDDNTGDIADHDIKANDNEDQNLDSMFNEIKHQLDDTSNKATQLTSPTAEPDTPSKSRTRANLVQIEPLAIANNYQLSWIEGEITIKSLDGLKASVKV